MDIKKFVSDYRLRQSELAELFSCTPANASNIVNGKRNLTGLHIRLLIEKYGYDVISRYCDPSELPAQPIIVHAPNVHDNKGQVNTGGTNTQTIAPPDNDLISVLKKQSEVLSSQSAQITRLIEQQQQLINLLTSK